MKAHKEKISCDYLFGLCNTCAEARLNYVQEQFLQN